MSMGRFVVILVVVMVCLPVGWIQAPAQAAAAVAVDQSVQPLVLFETNDDIQLDPSWLELNASMSDDYAHSYPYPVESPLTPINIQANMNWPMRGTGHVNGRSIQYDCGHYVKEWAKAAPIGSRQEKKVNGLIITQESDGVGGMKMVGYYTIAGDVDKSDTITNPFASVELSGGSEYVKYNKDRAEALQTTVLNSFKSFSKYPYFSCFGSSSMSRCRTLGQIPNVAIQKRWVNSKNILLPGTSRPDSALENSLPIGRCALSKLAIHIAHLGLQPHQVICAAEAVGRKMSFSTRWVEHAAGDIVKRVVYNGDELNEKVELVSSCVGCQNAIPILFHTFVPKPTITLDSTTTVLPVPQPQQAAQPNASNLKFAPSNPIMRSATVTAAAAAASSSSSTVKSQTTTVASIPAVTSVGPIRSRDSLHWQQANARIPTTKSTASARSQPFYKTGAGQIRPLGIGSGPVSTTPTSNSPTNSGVPPSTSVLPNSNAYLTLGETISKAAEEARAELHKKMDDVSDFQIEQHQAVLQAHQLNVEQVDVLKRLKTEHNALSSELLKVKALKLRHAARDAVVKKLSELKSREASERASFKEIVGAKATAYVRRSFASSPAAVKASLVDFAIDVVEGKKKQLDAKQDPVKKLYADYFNNKLYIQELEQEKKLKQ